MFNGLNFKIIHEQLNNVHIEKSKERHNTQSKIIMFACSLSNRNQILNRKNHTFWLIQL